MFLLFFDFFLNIHHICIISEDPMLSNLSYMSFYIAIVYPTSTSVRCHIGLRIV